MDYGLSSSALWERQCRKIRDFHCEPWAVTIFGGDRRKREKTSEMEGEWSTVSNAMKR